MKKLLHHTRSVAKCANRLAQVLVRFYQITLSPDHGPLRHIFPGGFCRYTPSCSSYTHEAIGKYGLIRGTIKSIWRILRCNPWSKGGIDLP